MTAKTKKPASKKTARASIAERTALAIRQAGAHARGEPLPGAVVHKAIDVKAVRAKMNMTQQEFAASFGLSRGAVRDWEQGRKTPERTAQILLRVIAHNPEAVERALKETA